MILVEGKINEDGAPYRQINDHVLFNILSNGENHSFGIIS